MVERSVQKSKEKKKTQEKKGYLFLIQSCGCFLPCVRSRHEYDVIKPPYRVWVFVLLSASISRTYDHDRKSKIYTKTLGGGSRAVDAEELLWDVRGMM